MKYLLTILLFFPLLASSQFVKLRANVKPGTFVDTTTIPVPILKPSCTLLSADTITAGDITDISWVTINSDSLWINPYGVAFPVNTGSAQVSPVTTTTYTGHAYSATDSATCSTTIVVIPLPTPAPDCSLSPTSVSITSGSLDTIMYRTSNATGITFDNGIGSPTPADSGMVTTSPSATTTYTATVTGLGGTATCSTTITVTALPPPPAPTCNISISPSSITQGSSATLLWTTGGSTTDLYIEWIGNVTPVGSGSVSVSPSITTTYTGTATGSDTIGTCSATLTVIPLPATCVLSTNPDTISNGNSSTLSWTTQNADSLVLSGIGKVATGGGSISVSPTTTTTYTGTVYGIGSSSTCTTKVVVNTIYADKLAYSFVVTDTTKKVSAGVFRSDGTLVRTLFNNVSYPIGTYVKRWDGLLDNGTLAPELNYEIKALANNVRDEWEGVIGNTSDSALGGTVLRSFDFMNDMVITGNTIYYSTNYTEGGRMPSLKTYVNDLQKKRMINSTTPGGNGTGNSIQYVTTDGTLVYWGCLDPYDEVRSFVYATKVSDDVEYTFTNGAAVNQARGADHQSALSIDLNTKWISGLAVQKTGCYLFVARKDLNKIDVYNKTTGAFVRAITITTPRSMACDYSNNLWVISATNTATKYTVNNDGTITAVHTLSGLVDPITFGVKNANDSVYVADGGSSQQVKVYSNVTGSQGVTFGQLGGYRTSPEVSNDRFYFNDNFGRREHPIKTFIAFQTDGKFWIGDVGNTRSQRYNANRSFDTRIMFSTHTYSVAVDINTPTRVFEEYKEFEVNYSLPIRQSWTLKRNWMGTVAYEMFPNDASIKEIFRSVKTLSNGRTYAFLREKTDKSRWALVELVAGVGVRNTGIRFDLPNTYIINQNGSLTKHSKIGAIGGNLVITRRPLTGFDGSNNPVWGAEVTIASIPLNNGLMPIDASITNGQTTSNGTVITYAADELPGGSNASHLGGIRQGDNKFQFLTSEATFKNVRTIGGVKTVISEYEGDMPTDGAFDIGNGVVYPGGDVFVQDSSIFTTYHGEFWKQSQTNIYNHFHQSGLMVNQFGVLGTINTNTNNAWAGLAGNVVSGNAVKVNGNTYIYTNDEGQHGGVHRWKVSNLSSVEWLPVTFPALLPYVPLPGEYITRGLPIEGATMRDTLQWVTSANVTTARNNTWFTAKSGSKSYDRFKDPDVTALFRYAAANIVKTSTRNLTVPSNVISWELSGPISFEFNVANDEGTTKGGSYIQVLDVSGKVISRFYMRALNSTTWQIVANNAQVLYQGTETQVRDMVKNFKDFTISVNASGTTVNYNGYSVTNVPVTDPLANWSNPGSVRLYFFTGSTPRSADRAISIGDLRFSTVATTSPGWRLVTHYVDGTLMNNSYVDNIIYKKIGSDYYIRIFDDAIQASWFGITGDSTQNATTVFVKALKAAVAHNVWLEMPAGYVNASTFTSGLMGTVAGNIKIRGTGRDASTLIIKDQVYFHGDLILKNCTFKGKLDEYLFFFPRILNDQDTGKVIQVDSCRFNTFRVAIGAYNNDTITTNYIDSFSYVKNSIFENFVAIPLNLRYRTKDLVISHNVFQDALDENAFVGAVIVGDKRDVWSAHGVVIDSNYFYNLYNPEVDSSAIHIVLSYARKNILSNNYFLNCRRALYSRGDSGIIENNIVINNDSAKYGILPFIFKGGVGGTHTMRNNTVIGWYDGILDLDDQETGINMHDNILNLIIIGANPKIFWYISSGTKGYTEQQIMHFHNNTGTVFCRNNYTTFNMQFPLGSLIIENNYWKDISTDRITKSFVSAYTSATGLKNLIIRNNQYLSIPTLAYTNAQNRIIEGNNFYFRNFDYGGWYRTTDGIKEVASNNNFYMDSGYTANANSFSGLWLIDGGTDSIVHKNFHVEGNGIQTAFYRLQNTDSLDLDIDSFYTGNIRLISLKEAGVTNIKLNNLTFAPAQPQLQVIEYGSAPPVTNTTVWLNGVIVRTPSQQTPLYITHF